ncbi:MAG: zinc ribbon domain-containing protein [Rhizobacter sp.]|nr:zinc ribbon domain-containing protein [Rhizobacter sp.]
MPIYAYRCEACGHAKDVLQKFSDAVLTECPACGAAAFKKQVTAAGFQLKGSGWYVTDFRGDSKAAKPKGDGDAPAAKPADGAAEPAKTVAGNEQPTKAEAAKPKPAEKAAAVPAAAPAPPAPAPAPAAKSGTSPPSTGRR